MRRRVITALAALVVAAIGAWLLVSTTARERDDAVAAARATSVLVATERIEAGTSAADARASVSRASVPASALVPGVLTDLDEVAGLRAVGPILPGQQIVAGQWGDATSSPLSPPRGTLGLAVQLGDPQRVAGFATPGSKVAVFATISVPGGTGPTTRLLLPQVTVLGTGGSTVATHTTESDGRTSTEEVPSAVLTLALTPAEAERVVFAAGQGELWLGLLGDRGPVPSPGPGVSAETLFDGVA